MKKQLVLYTEKTLPLQQWMAAIIFLKQRQYAWQTGLNERKLTSEKYKEPLKERMTTTCFANKQTTVEEITGWLQDLQ